MTLRVLMVTREWPEDRRFGIGRSLDPLLAPMKKSGVDVRYFCQADLPAAALADRAKWLHRLSGLPGIRGRNDLVNLLRAWVERLQVGAAAGRLAAREGFTHVHAHDPWLAMGVSWSLRGTNSRNIRWGLTQHGFGSYARATHEDGLVQSSRMQGWLHRIEKAVCARARWVTAPTQAALDRLAADLGISATQAHWHCIPHARPKVQPATPSQRTEARANSSLSDHDILVIAVGRLVPLKRFDRVIDACARLQDPRVHLQLLGTGDAAALRGRAKAAGLENLHIATADDMAPHYHAADIYVSASSTESFGLANLEALCAGLPSICSAVGGVPEVVGNAAWLVDGETGTLEHALREWIADPPARAQWAARAAQRGLGWPDAQQIADRYVALYQTA